jgi:hypothetical protein
MKYWIYKNLHKGCFSVKRGSAGRVFHADAVLATDVDFHVREGGRQRVLVEKKKNVHAFVRCMGMSTLHQKEVAMLLADGSWTEVTYNPYRGGSFYLRDSGVEVRTAATALLDGGKVYVAALGVDDS